MTDESYIIGFGTTKFGELWSRSLSSLLQESIQKALENAGVEIDKIGAIFVSNMLGGVLENNVHLGAKISELFGVNIPIFRVESACASGGQAFLLADRYLKSGSADTILVVGGEKMTDVSTEIITQALSSASSGEEQQAGLTFPGLYAMLATVYLNKYDYDSSFLAHISVKNHAHGVLNPNAQFRKNITVGDVLKSPHVADPLRLLDCSPISDGACAIVLTSNKKLVQRDRPKTKVLATETATDSISLKGRKQLDQLQATVIAGQKAYAKAGISTDKIGLIELHDCFSIAEVLALEDLGFWQRGSGGKLAEKYTTLLGGEGSFVVNTSGGLKAAGHPVAATGLKQLGEIHLQLNDLAGDRQIKNLQYGLAHNVGGSGGSAVVSILGKAT